MGWLLGGLATLLYLLTLSRHYSADSVLYALRIEGGALEQILDPTHLLIEPAGYGWFWLWQGLGWQEGALIPLQVLNALAGGTAVGLLYGIGRGMSGSRRIGGVTAAGFAVSGGLWLLSVEAEFVTLPLAAALLVLWLVLVPPERLVRRNAAYAAALGAAIALAMLFYLNGVLLLVVAGVGLVMGNGRSWRVQIGQIAIMALLVGVVCLPVGALLLMTRSWTVWTAQIWQDGGQGYLALAWLDGPHGGYAFLRSLALFPGQALNDSGRAFLRSATWPERLAFGTYYGLIFVAALTPVYLAIRRRQRLWPGRRREIAVLAVWSMLYAAFAVAWVPGDISFWLPVLAAWWLLVALVVAVIAGDLHKKQSRANGWPRVGWLAVAVVGLAVLNLATVIGPRHDLATNAAYQLATEVAAQTSAKDLIISGGDDIVTLYLVYFGGRTVLPVGNLANGRRSIEAQFGAWIEETRANGGQAFVLLDGQLVFLSP